jgi:hypothetical protein
VDSTDNLLSCGIDGLEGLAVNALNPFVVDEPAGKTVNQWLRGDPTRPDEMRGNRVSTYNPVGCSYLPVDGV